MYIFHCFCPRVNFIIACKIFFFPFDVFCLFSKLFPIFPRGFFKAWKGLKGSKGNSNFIHSLLKRLYSLRPNGVPCKASVCFCVSVWRFVLVWVYVCERGQWRGECGKCVRELDVGWGGVDGCCLGQVWGGESRYMDAERNGCSSDCTSLALACWKTTT